MAVSSTGKLVGIRTTQEDSAVGHVGPEGHSKFTGPPSRGDAGRRGRLRNQDRGFRRWENRSIGLRVAFDEIGHAVAARSESGDRSCSRRRGSRHGGAQGHEGTPLGQFLGKLGARPMSIKARTMAGSRPSSPKTTTRLFVVEPPKPQGDIGKGPTRLPPSPIASGRTRGVPSLWGPEFRDCLMNSSSRRLYFSVPAFGGAPDPRSFQITSKFALMQVFSLPL